MSNSDPTGWCVTGNGNNQQCKEAIEKLSRYRISLHDESAWQLTELETTLEAIDDIFRGTGWSELELRLAMTGFSQFGVELSNDMPFGEGFVDPNISYRTIKMHVGIRGDNLIARYTFMHEFAHVWDNALYHRLSNGFVEATGGRTVTERTIVPVFPFIITTQHYEICSPILVPEGYYGAASQYEDWAESFVAVVAPDNARLRPRQLATDSDQLFIDVEAEHGGQRKHYVETQITGWPRR